jgi:hypothetical protein
MSQDFKIQNRCDHKINWVAGVLASDRRRIDVPYLIASKASVVLRINNVVRPSSEYKIVRDLSAVDTVKPLYILMNNRIKHNDPLIEVQYVTLLNRCPKCLGTKFLDDITYNASGDITQVKDEFLLLQTVEKYIVTNLRSNRFHDWMGTNLHTLVGTKILDVEQLRNKVVDEVTLAIEKLKDIQRQLVSTGRPVSAGELFGNLISVDLSQEYDDLSIISVTVRFTAQSGKRLNYTQLLELTELRQRISFS